MYLRVWSGAVLAVAPSLRVAFPVGTLFVAVHIAETTEVLTSQDVARTTCACTHPFCGGCHPCQPTLIGWPGIPIISRLGLANFSSNGFSRLMLRIEAGRSRAVVAGR
jgi:hypothetical protein